MKIEPEFDVVRRVFYFLKNRALRKGNRDDIIVALWLLCMPRLGLRPIELFGARRDGQRLIVPTAKRGGAWTRAIPLIGWPRNHVVALDLLLGLIPRGLDDAAFIRRRNSLASRLARASERTCNQRLALYFTRHIAIAAWRELGLSRDEIRILAGHAGIASQNVYGRGGRAVHKWLYAGQHAADFSAAISESAAPETIQAASNAPLEKNSDPEMGGETASETADTEAPPSLMEFDVDDMPTPAATTKVPAESTHWQDYVESLDAKFDMRINPGGGPHRRRPTAGERPASRGPAKNE